MKKCDFLFVCLSRFGITLLCNVIFKTIMIPLHRGRFLVVHLYSSFAMDSVDFPLGTNLFYSKNYHFCQFWGHKPTF